MLAYFDFALTSCAQLVALQMLHRLLCRKWWDPIINHTIDNSAKIN